MSRRQMVVIVVGDVVVVECSCEAAGNADLRWIGLTDAVELDSCSVIGIQSNVDRAGHFAVVTDFDDENSMAKLRQIARREIQGLRFLVGSLEQQIPEHSSAGAVLDLAFF